MILTQTLFIDSSGMLWVGTGDGLYKFNIETKEETYYVHIDGDVKSISNNYIYSIFEDKKGILWIGTGGGLNKFDRSTETFSHFTENDGLPSNVVKGILEDGHDNIWLSTTKGISKFNPISETFRNFDAADGLQGDEFITGAYHKNQQGEMFFGGTNGLTTFHPDSIKNNIYIPPITITDFQIFNKSVKPGNKSPLKKQVSETSEIALSHDQSIFSFEFAALDYHNPLKNQYKYKMEGVDPDWVSTDASRRFATYTNLDPGDYIFRVRGSNNDGIWNDEGTSIKIIITPPWWQSNWAYAFYGLLIFVAIFLARKYDLKRINLRNESNRLKEIDQLKSRFFANISHEFRTPLTLILGPIQKLLEDHPTADENNQYSLIQRNALRLQRLINQLLDISRLEAGKLKLNAREYDIIAITRAIIANFESHANRRNISLTFHSSLKFQNVYLNFDKFEKILTNLLSNAFKFSDDDTAISITLETISDSTGSFNEGYIRLCIQDQGIGVKEENIEKIFQRFYQVDDTATRGYEGSGIGLALVKEMVDLHYGTINVKSEPGKGTTFIVCLPLGKSHLSLGEIEQLPVDEIKVPDEPLDETVIRILNENTDQLPLVLIVEDNIDVQQYIGSFLEEDHNLIFADNGKEGLNRAIQEIPDLIISDVMMPVMDGIELSTELKSDERTSHIPVILLTARATVEDRVEGLETGADDYLQKPFDVNELRVRIKNLIEQRKLLKEKFVQEDGFLISKLSKTPADERFINRMMDIISDNISEPAFKIESLSKEIGMSRMQLHRKIQGLFGQSPGQFLRSLRLKQSADLLKNVTGNISEIAYDVGFESPAHFTSSFRRQFGMTPSEYQKQQSTT
jgi:signal transduction histidine kinase/AraC-like DNA-binding protein